MLALWSNKNPARGGVFYIIETGTSIKLRLSLLFRFCLWRHFFSGITGLFNHVRSLFFHAVGLFYCSGVVLCGYQLPYFCECVVESLDAIAQGLYIEVCLGRLHRPSQGRLCL